MVNEAGIRETVRHVLLPLWNSWYFLTLYANAANVQGTIRTTSEHRIDRYLLAKTRDLVGGVTDSLDAYDLFGACQQVRDFLDVLTNWFVRRSRSRFWEGDRDAIDTLHTVLTIFSQLTAPLLPLISESIYLGLNSRDDGPTSVHLTDWPSVDQLPADDELVATMDLVRQVCSATLSVRKIHQRRVRLPLQTLTVAVPDAERLVDFTDVIAQEVNVRDIVLTSDVASVASERLQLVPKALGPRLGAAVQDVIRAHKAGDWSVNDDVVTVGGHELLDGEFTLELVAGDDQASAGLPGNSGVIALDIDVTDELEIEGRARDLIRLIQQARRDAGLHVSDRVRLTVHAAPEWLAALAAHHDLVARETLATEVLSGAADGDPVITVERVIPS